MNTTPSDDEMIEALLREAPPDELPDDGFSLRVMQALPPERSRAGFRRWILAGVCAAVGIAAVSGDSGLFRAVSGIVTGAVATASNPVVVVILGITVAAAAILATDDYLGLEF